MRSMQWQLGMLGTISAFAYRHRETKKNLCRGGLSQDLPNTDFQPMPTDGRWDSIRRLRVQFSSPVSKPSKLSNKKGKIYHRTGHETPEGNICVALLFLQPRRQWWRVVNATFRGRFKAGNEPVPIVEEAGSSPESACRSVENLSSLNGIRSPDSPIQRKG